MILAVDPGTTQSAYVIFNDGVIREKGIIENHEFRKMLHDSESINNCSKLYIEMVASYGMPVGKTVFETCVWIGRFIEAFGGCQNFEFVYRKDVKMFLCGQTRAKDSNIRQAIMDMYGSTRRAAIGIKSEPGALYGCSKDIWAALAVAITATSYEA